MEKREMHVKCEVCGRSFDNYPSLVAHLYEHIRELRDANLKLQGALEEAEKHIHKPSVPSPPPWKPVVTKGEPRWKVSRWES